MALALRRLGPILAVVMLPMAVIAARVVLDARAGLRAGRDAEQAGQTRLALAHYQSAARAYLPGSPYSRAAFDRLFEIGTAAEKLGDWDNARRAFEGFRAAALGTRSFFLPHARRVEAVEFRIAGLYADWEMRLRPQAGVDRAARFREHQRLLAARPGPGVAAALVACVALCGWVGAAVAFIMWGVGPSLRLRPVPALAAAVGFVVSFATFLIALRKS